MRRFALAVLAALAAAPAGPGRTASVEDLRDLRIGTPVADMPATGYYEFACGTNGGPPGRPIPGWAAFRQCAPEANGLHEVFVRFDDEFDFMSRVLNEVEGEGLAVAKWSGTKIAGHPVILSTLFDSAGVLQGIRAVTDPRAGVGQRRHAYLLRVRVLGRYGRSGWACVDSPPEEGQTPVGGLFIKQRCERIFQGARRIVVQTHLFRKAGQTGFDDAGLHKPGDFESGTRFEVLSLAVAPTR